MRPNIVLHNATLKTMVAQTPVKMRFFLDKIVTAGPNMSKSEGTSVIKCDNVEAFVTESIDDINALIRNTDSSQLFTEVTAVLKDGKEQKILVRKDSIIADFESNVDACTILNTLVGPIRVLEKYIS